MCNHAKIFLHHPQWKKQLRKMLNKLKKNISRYRIRFHSNICILFVWCRNFWSWLYCTVDVTCVCVCVCVLNVAGIACTNDHNFQNTVNLQCNEAYDKFRIFFFLVHWWTSGNVVVVVIFDSQRNAAAAGVKKKWWLWWCGKEMVLKVVVAWKENGCG